MISTLISHPRIFNLDIFCARKTLARTFTTVFVDTRLWKTKHPRKRFQNFRPSCVLSTDRIEIRQSQRLVCPSDLLYVILAGCDWWISIRSVSLKCARVCLTGEKFIYVKSAWMVDCFWYHVVFFRCIVSRLVMCQKLRFQSWDLENFKHVHSVALFKMSSRVPKAWKK